MTDRDTLTPAAFDAERLTQVLVASGALAGARVTDVAVEPVGVGMIGESLRFSLRYDRDGAGPASVVGKFASPDPRSRATGADFGLYLAEVRFYQELAQTVAVSAPRCHYAGIDETTSEFAIILEDLTPARAGDQLNGCSLADAHLAIAEAAALHGPRWGDPTLNDLSYLADRGQGLALVRSIFPACLTEFHRRYDGVLEPEYMAVCDRFGQAIAEFHARKFRFVTLTHFDFRLDNMLFDTNSGEKPLMILDWQSISIASGALDVAYFMGLALPIELRRQNETQLLQLYLDALNRHGVRDYGYDDLFHDYRVTALQGVSTAVFASASTKRTERGDAMFLAMARGSCAQAIDAQSFQALQAA